MNTTYKWLFALRTIVRPLLGVALLLHAASGRAQFIGWACGGTDEQGGVLLCTTNGTDWFRQGVGQVGTNTLAAVAAVAGRFVWAVGDPEEGYAAIYHSTDAGVTWTRQGDAASLPDAPLHKIWAVDERVLWAVGVDGAVVTTDDGGLTWRQVPVPGYSKLLQGVTATDARTAWVSGEAAGTNRVASLFYTADGGATWTAQGGTVITNTAHLLGLAALDRNRVWAIGQHEVILVTTNAGASWDLLYRGAEKDGNEICVLDDQRIWGAFDSHLEWTTNGGAAWARQGTADYAMDVSTPDGTNIWAVADGYYGGIIYYSPDGGATWTQQARSSTWIGLNTIEVQRAERHSTLYVSAAATNPIPPYANWQTAATNIQDAIDAAGAGAVVIVNDGVYSRGGRAAGNGQTLTNRACIDKPITVRSLQGPARTFVVGSRDPGAAGGVGLGAVRAVWLGNSAKLIGFTVTNGYTVPEAEATGDRSDSMGGGIWCQGSGAVITHCVITGNTAYNGGGVANGRLYNCLVSGNVAAGRGGGIYGSEAHACTIVGNLAAEGGGAAGVYSGGDYPVRCAVHSSVVYYNQGNAKGTNHLDALIYNSCTIPWSDGGQNVDAPPGFVDPGNGFGTNHVPGDYHLQPNSPCVNLARIEDWMQNAVDLDGNPRILNGAPDIGAYESPYWGTLSDLDQDGFTDWVEVNLTRTSPTNAASYLHMAEAAPLPGPTGGVKVRWASVEGVRYQVLRSTNLVANPAFTRWLENVPGQAGFTTVTDATTTATGPYFYRVAVAP